VELLALLGGAIYANAAWSGMSDMVALQVVTELLHRPFRQFRVQPMDNQQKGAAP
jgi:hypothetical protein